MSLKQTTTQGFNPDRIEPIEIGLSLKQNLKRQFIAMVQSASRLLFKSEFCWKLTSIVCDEFQREQVRIEDGLLARFVDDRESIIQSGAFAGMRYGTEAVGGALLPKIIGSYECQLSDLIAGFADRDYSRAVDIGSAEGYYVVGLARLMPQAKIYAFDIDPRAHQLCRDNAERNAVLDQIRFKNECTPGELAKVIAGKTLIVCDCEGFEAEILDPVATPELEQCDILVELHDLIVPGVSDLIYQRFKDSHEIEFFSESVRDAEAYPALRGLKDFEASLAMNEKRGGRMQWAFLESRKSKQG
jgi:hypothetical protein